MRLVDISFKDINGQASDIKGNMHNIGHIMMMQFQAVDREGSKRTAYSGYFEIDGSTVKDAITNYSELYTVLNTPYSSTKDMMAKIEVNTGNIILNSKPALLGIRAAGSGHSGEYIPATMGDHTHKYWQGEQVYTPTGPTTIQTVPPFYSLRFFIYHGVH